MTARNLTIKSILTFSLLFSLLFGGTAWSGADPKLFPRPAGLEPAVQFWTKVFSEVTTREGYIHDDWHLDVIYQTFKFDRKLTRRQNQKRLEREKKKIAKILRTLSRGKRSGLSKEEQRILALWPKNVSNNTLRKAVNRVRFQLGQADKFKAGLIRSGRWRSFILKNLEKNGLPREIAALPHVESSFNPKAYSHVGAAGLWQFTRSTGRRFMRIDHIVDERMDPFKASVAAARLLQNNHDVIGTWPLAMTAYNHGAAGMRHAAKKMGTTDIDYIIKHYKSRSFKFASRNFYTAFLAVNDIQDDYKKYFPDVQLEPAINDEKLKLPAYVSVNDLTKALGISKSELQQRNPALRPAVWNNSKYIPKGYEIRIRPGSSKYSPEQALARLKAGNMYAKQKPDRYHRVRRGQTLSTIAARYGVSVKSIARLNNIRRRNRIRVGQVLRLPQRGARGRHVEPEPVEPVEAVTVAKASKRAEPKSRQDGDTRYYKVRRGDSIAKIAKRFGLKQRTLVKMNSLNRRKPIYPGQMLAVGSKATTVAKANDDGMYKVRRGDSLARIAGKFDLSQKQLLAWNDDIRRNKPIYPGQMIRVSAEEQETTDSKSLQLASLDESKQDGANVTEAVNNAAAEDGQAVEETAASADDTEQSSSAEQAESASETAASDAESTETENAADNQPSEIADNTDNAGDKKATQNNAFVMMISEYLDNDSSKNEQSSMEEHLPAIDDAPGKAEVEVDPEQGDVEPNVPAIAEDIDQPVNLEPPVDAKLAQAQMIKPEQVFTKENPDITTDVTPSSAVLDDGKATATIEESTEAIEEESAISADPTDYTVSNNKTIEVQASETLGHYAEWLGIRASRLRRLNHMRYRTPLVIGKRLKLDFRHVSPQEFVKLRVAYHRSLQEAYFEQFEITGSERHRVKRGESLWKLAKRKYKIPVWLFRQYNPDLAFNKFRAGITVTFPSVSPRNSETEDSKSKDS